jgi:hypothetical protein
MLGKIPAMSKHSDRVDFEESSEEGLVPRLELFQGPRLPQVTNITFVDLDDAPNLWPILEFLLQNDKDYEAHT